MVLWPDLGASFTLGNLAIPVGVIAFGLGPVPGKEASPTETFPRDLLSNGLGA
ncbi:MAG: hypothetical protein R6V45_08965 [Oceanipulchritudo sp.]